MCITDRTVTLKSCLNLLLSKYSSLYEFWRVAPNNRNISSVSLYFLLLKLCILSAFSSILLEKFSWHSLFKKKIGCAVTCSSKQCFLSCRKVFYFEKTSYLTILWWIALQCTICNVKIVNFLAFFLCKFYNFFVQKRKNTLFFFSAVFIILNFLSFLAFCCKVFINFLRKKRV